MLISNTTKYAIRATTHLARLPAGTLAGALEIAHAANIPMPFLWKILHKLSQGRVVRSFKGKGGGYELARPADLITLQDLLAATSEDDLAGYCLLGHAHCDPSEPCQLHGRWNGLRARVLTMLRTTTVGDLARMNGGNNGRETTAALVENVIAGD